MERDEREFRPRGMLVAAVALITLGSGEVAAAAPDPGHEEVNLNADGVVDIQALGVEQVQVNGGAGNDVISADGGDNTRSPVAVGVTIDGGAGNDTLTGGDGGDTLNGGSGNDSLQGETRADTLSGGP